MGSPRSTRTCSFTLIDYRFPACDGLAPQFSQEEQMCVLFLKHEHLSYPVDFMTTSGAVEQCFDEHALYCLFVLY